MTPPVNDAAILALERPHPNLFTYYWVSLLLFPPLLPFVILVIGAPIVFVADVFLDVAGTVVSLLL